MADDKPEEWPRALRGAYEYADPTDPTLPPAAPGSAVESAIAAKLAGRFPQYNDPDLKPIQFAEVFARLLALSVARLEFLGALLAAEYERASTGGRSESGNEYDPGIRTDGLSAFIGDVYDLDKHGEQVPVGEAVRALVQLEAAERDRAARLAKEAIRIGVQAQQVDVMRSYGHTVVAALRAFAEQQNIDWTEEGTRKAAQRAILTARSRLGAESLTMRGNDERD